MTTFVEPGTGLTMTLGKWYVMSDSGSAFCDTGFDSPEAAQQWWKDEGREVFEFPGETKPTLIVPKFIDGDWDDFDSPQILKADDLLKFWESNPLGVTEP